MQSWRNRVIQLDEHDEPPSADENASEPFVRRGRAAAVDGGRLTSDVGHLDFFQTGCRFGAYL